MKAVFRFGYEYQKVGLMPKGVVSGYYLQRPLFAEDPDERQGKLSDMVIDSIIDTVGLGGAGYGSSWHHKR